MNIPFILHIETATPVCSVALSRGPECLVVRELDEPNIHASQLTVLIDQALTDVGVSFADLAAVSVSMGPGSYTGLRIGVSTAKGLCYALDIPLVAVRTLDAMAEGFSLHHGEHIGRDALLVPMIDARRMEVYMAGYNAKIERVIDVAARVIDGDSFAHHTNDSPIWLFGSGASKFSTLFEDDARVLVSPGFKNSAAFLVKLAYEAYRKRSFEDVVYFEPYYLKEFVATTPKTSR